MSDWHDHAWAFLGHLVGGAIATSIALGFMFRQLRWVRASITSIVAHVQASHSYNQWTHATIRAICNGLHIRAPEAPSITPLKVDTPPPEGPDLAAISGGWRKP